MQYLWGQQQLFLAGAAAVEVDGREHALFVEAAVQVNLAVAGALEFLKDHLVHAAAGVDQRGADDGQAAAFFDFAGRTEKTLGALQGVSVHAAGQHLAGRWQDIVIGTGQAGDRVEQYHHVFTEFDQALGALNHHLGHMHVASGRLVKGRRDHFAAHAALHFGHFFRALVHQQHHHHGVGVVGSDRVGDVLHHHGLAGLGRRHQQGALAFADRGNDVDDPAGQILFALHLAFELVLLAREQRRQVLEHHLVLVVFRCAVVDLVELVQCKVTLAVFGRAHFAFDHVAGVQVEAADLAGADIDVVGRGGVARVRCTQKAKAVGQHFQHTVGDDGLAGLGALFDDRKHQLLLAHAADVFDLKCFGLLEDFRHMQCLEFV